MHQDSRLHCVQIAHELGLHRHTVEKYVRMTLEEFQSSQSYEREFKYKLDIYEEEVKNELIRAPYLSSRQIHAHLVSKTGPACLRTSAIYLRRQ